MAQNSDFKHVTKLDLDIDKIAQEAVDAAQDILINSKQDTLVSGENIKTINGTSVLGSGDVTVQEQLVSGTNIKTINGTSVLGEGDIVVGGSDDVVIYFNKSNIDSSKGSFYLTLENSKTRSNPITRQNLYSYVTDEHGLLKNVTVFYYYDDNKNSTFKLTNITRNYTDYIYGTCCGSTPYNITSEPSLFGFSYDTDTEFKYFYNTVTTETITGRLNNLQTTAKTSLVAAINELVTRVAALEA